ncbi:MAG: ATP-dependent Clp protease ATP-binding subunit, partial [bacterium]|nr:ATP-dependent Clp protease ATP-binding subunit [bacterium]
MRRVLVQAAQLAASEGKKRIEPTHLFYGLTNHAESAITDISAFSSKHSKKKQSKKTPISLVLAPISKKLILDAAAIASHYNHDHVGTEHLFVSLLESSHPSIKKLIQTHNIDSRKVKSQLGMILKSSSKIFDILETLLPPTDHMDHVDEHQPPQEHKTTSPRQRKVSALEYFAVHLTDPNHAQELDPLIGREKEIERLIRILARRTKNNPILLGLPGVGKTAIVEGLAKRISTGAVPEFFKNKKIFSLNLTALVAGSAFRGELEMRFKQVLDEVKHDPNVILFIDEIHNLVGAGSSNGSLDAANILKPALARGELRCVGATTFTEYKRYIEEDPALERRFQPIIVDQPSPLEAERILRGLVPYYEKYHNVEIAEDAVVAAVKLSNRYITEKCLPDKAIDLIDEAGAKTKLESRTTEMHQSLIKLQQQADEISAEKERALYELNDVVRAHELHQQEMHLKGMVTDLQKTIELKEHAPAGTITASTIAEIVASVTGIPVTSLVESEKERLLKLEEQLSKSIVGQEEAKKSISNYIRRAKSGLINRGRPMASFAFLGPSGVGKTELARTLAEEIFGKDGLIKLDMSEFSESFTI